MKKRPPLTGIQINWNQLFYFCEVATAGSIKGAAEKLGLSSPTLSEHIGQLEEDLQVALFHRQHRKLVLTPAGIRIFQNSKPMFEQGQRLIDVVSPLPLGCYPVSVGLVPNSSIQVAYRLIDRYLQGQTQMNMKLHKIRPEELERGLSEARLDFGFSDHPAEHKDIVDRVVSVSSLGFYAKAGLADRGFVALFRELPLLICNSQMGARTALEKFLEEAGLSPKSVITSDFPSLLIELCRTGRGIGVFGEAIADFLPSTIKSLVAPKGTPRLVDKLHLFWSRDGENSLAIQHLKRLLEDPSKST
jgi:DNA-binding transcriptional LysR family regulator